MGDEQFHDYTVATAFERFVASIESCLTTWRDKELGPALSWHRQQEQLHGNDSSGGGGSGSSGELITLQAQLQHRLPFRSEPYNLTLHLSPLAQQQQQGELGCQQQPPPLLQQSSTDPALPAAAAAVPRPAPGGTAGSWASGLSAAALPAVASGLDMLDAPHRLLHWFGTPALLLLKPDSYSGRVLDEQEAHTLLSAAAVALSHARMSWPLLLPVHDAVRDGYRGVAAAMPVAAGAAAAGGSTLKLDTDSVHSSSRLPVALLHLDQQLLLFARQLAAAAAPAAAAACRAAVGAELGGSMPASMAADAAAAGNGSGHPAAAAAAGGGGSLQVAAAVRHSYALPSPGDEADNGSSWEDESPAGGSSSGGSGEWDASAPWRPWAAQADPIGCLELDVVWRFPSVATALHQQAAAAAAAGTGSRGHGPGGLGADLPPLVPAQAADWRLLALSTGYERDTGHRGFALRPVDKPRRFLRLQTLEGQRAQRILAGEADVAPALLPGDSSFYGMLLTLLESCKWAARAPSLGSLASADWWPQQGTYMPPLPAAWVLQEAVRDIFQVPALPVWPGVAAAAVAWPVSAAGQLGCLGKAAPLGALISRFALHALALGSPRAAAELWQRFVDSLRLGYWDQLRPLPRMRLRQEAEQQRWEHREQQQAQEQGCTNGSSSAAAAAAGCASADEPISASSISSRDGGAGSDPIVGQDGSSHFQVGNSSSSGSRPEAPNLDHSLLHQKLQLLDLCIHLQQQQQEQQREQQQPGKQQQRQRQVSAAVAATAGTAAAEGEGWEGASDDDIAAATAVDEGQQQLPASPSSSDSSSYHSAAAGSDVNLSPGRGQQEQQQQQPAAVPDGGVSANGHAAEVEAGTADGSSSLGEEAAAAGTETAGADAAADGAPGPHRKLQAASKPSAAVAPEAPEKQTAAAAAGGAAEVSATEMADGDPAVHPQGAAHVLPGAFLHLHPDRPLWVPQVQEAPAATEDLLAEQQAALQSLPSGLDLAALRARLQGRMLLSDMQAFKAANPGCCLLDFVRWHSPKDCCPAAGGGGGWELSGRMAAEGNSWQQLWASAGPVPASQQRPLFDPELEGERALHFLETLPPAALFSQLLAIGFSAAVQLLAAGGQAAGLPAVQRQLECLAAAAGPMLQQGVAATTAAAAAAASDDSDVGEEDNGGGAAAAAAEAVQEWQQGSFAHANNASSGRSSSRAPRRLSSYMHSIFGSGLSSSSYRRLLLLLGCTEQAVVAAHSLLLRLEQPPQQQQQQQQRGVPPSGGTSGSSLGKFAPAAADGLVAAALGDMPLVHQEQQQRASTQQQSAPGAALVQLAAAHWPEAEVLLVQRQQRWQDREADSDAASPTSSSGGGGAGGGWPDPFQREWLLEVHGCSSRSGSEVPGAEQGSRGGSGSVKEEILPTSAEAAAPHTNGAAGAAAAAGLLEAARASGSSSSSGVQHTSVLQRMFVRALPAEVRIATALSSEVGNCR